MEKNDLKLVFVSPVIENNKTGTYTYKLYYSENPDVVWGGYWDYENPSVAEPEDIYPDKSTYSLTENVTSQFKWGLAMKNACYPLLYCVYGILALSWIDIEDLEEYPENGRCVLKFGMNYDDVRKILEDSSYGFTFSTNSLD
jgi:hypothetical protein